MFEGARRPLEVLLVFPAANTAIESYVFNLHLSTLPANSIHRIGGWTQTSSAPSPMACMVWEQDRRQLTGRCFKCGSNEHFSNTKKRDGTLLCTKIEAKEYKCKKPGCGGVLLISCRGESSLAPPLTHHGVVRPVTTAPPPPPLLPPKRRASAAASPPAKKAKTEDSHVGKVVLVDGHAYTALSWHFGKDPTPKTRSLAKNHCSEGALEMSNGNFVSIINHGFAQRPPDAPPPLLPKGVVLCPVRWTNSKLTHDKGTLKLRLAGVDGLRCDLRQVLFLKADLDKLSANMWALDVRSL